MIMIMMISLICDGVSPHTTLFYLHIFNIDIFLDVALKELRKDTELPSWLIEVGGESQSIVCFSFCYNKVSIDTMICFGYK